MIFGVGIDTSFIRAQKNAAELNQQRLSGDDRARTDNLLRARQALSQLSYVPI